ncbi:thiamine pyrophosphate-binding protein [Microbacterium sp. TNHR37B]|uniref:thiamine pyrophosphate-binding protein n=1 Tax=Microbacterium sp. TNHR37B TaxID=1775956 RepID=UPI0007B1EDA9|nr:thiamine pyrophosphate-binding protein [Microbacterium sp. TNHR37B]KZE89858.1 putative 2-ketoarginine decarboxylase AruI [Microbacterium sp. TNHR37B]
MRFGEGVTRLLADYGVDTVFGIPGVHTIEIYRGLRDAGIASHPARHEQGVGFMADAYARQTGRPGVALLVTGPGLLNALTPLAQAWHDSVPLLFLAADTDTALAGRRRGPLHDVRDQTAAAAGVSDHVWRVTDPVEFPAVLAAAWAAMTTGRPGPAVISLPIDVLEREIAAPFTRLPLPSATPEPDPATLAEATRVLSSAIRPAILAGGGSRGAEVARLAESLDAPVVTTGNAAGVLAPAHPLNVGVLLPFAGAQRLLAEADVVLAIGTEFSETDVLYSGRPIQIDGTLVRVDVDPDALHVPFPADVAVLGDAATVVAALAESASRPADDGATRAADARANVAWTTQSEGHAPWIDAIVAATPADAVTVLDSTQLAYTLHQMVVPSSPTARIATYGLGTLGAAVPMAVGAAIAEPERPVLAIAGDGGVLFSLPELATAVDLGRQFTLLIWDNRGYGEIRDSFDRAGAERIDTEVTAHDHAAIARGFGAHAVTVDTPDELATALRDAFDSAGATVIVAREPSAVAATV